MKSIVVRWVLGAVVAGALGGTHTWAESPSLLEYHFAGTVRIRPDTNAATLVKIAALPESGVLSRQVLDRLAETPFSLLHARLPKEAQSQAALWRPLLDDLLAAESFGDLRDTGGHKEWTLALRLADHRAGLWNTNLTQIARAWKLSGPKPVRVADAPGWEASSESDAGLFQIVRVRDWVVLGLGRERLTVVPAWVQQIAKEGQPGTAFSNQWLTARVDFPRLSRLLPGLAAFDLPPTDFRIAARDRVLRTTAVAHFADPLQWAMDGWRIPTNSIGEPLISFTVARGFAARLKKIPGFAELGLDTTPNQVCLWGQSNPHVQMCATTPVGHATNQLDKIKETLPALLRKFGATGQFIWNSNVTMLIWQTAPFIFPSLLPLRDGNQDYLLGLFFPLLSGPTPVPAQLFAQLGDRANLIYYDWELTSERLPQMNRLWQLIDIARERPGSDAELPTRTWVKAAAPLLGNSVTEITQTGPQEVTLVRKSEAGFTGFEMATLLRWIESPGFPLTFDDPAPADPTAAKPPGTQPPGTVPPGTVPPGTVPPGTKPPGTNPPPPATPRAPAKLKTR